MAEYVPFQKFNPMSVVESSAHLMNQIDHPAKGRSVPRMGMAVHTWDPIPPGEPDSRWLEPDDFYRDCHITGEGVGDGVDWPWVSDDGTRGGDCVVEWLFSFYPTQSDVYTLSSGVIAAGPYSVYADDGAFDSKEVSIDIQASMHIEQVLPGPIQVGNITVTSVSSDAWKDLFQLDSQNIKDAGNCVGADTLTSSLLLFENLPVNVSVTVDAQALARGDGSWVDLNLARPDGVICCLGLTLKSQ
jgi:hypothetical protein